MRNFAIFMILVGLLGIAGCASNDCSVPPTAKFAVVLTDQASSSNNCAADIVSAFETFGPVTFSFPATLTCGPFNAAYEENPTLMNGTDCTGDAQLMFADLEPSGGTATGVYDVTCKDGTSCTETFTTTLTRSN